MASASLRRRLGWGLGRLAGWLAGGRCCLVQRPPNWAAGNALPSRSVLVSGLPGLSSQLPCLHKGECRLDQLSLTCGKGLRHWVFGQQILFAFLAPSDPRAVSWSGVDWIFGLARVRAGRAHARGICTIHMSEGGAEDRRRDIQKTVQGGQSNRKRSTGCYHQCLSVYHLL